VAPDRPVAVVTGGSRGIGRAISGSLATAGYNVVINYLSSREIAESASADIGKGRSIAVQSDVSSPDGASRLLTSTMNAFGRVDVLINNAGVILRGSHWRTMSKADWDKTVDVNLFAVFNCIRVFSEPLVSSGGRVVNISSIFAFLGAAPVAGYAAAKAGVHTLTKSFARELAPRVTVNTVAPGTIDTEMTRAADQEFLARVIENTPAKRLGTPDDIASAVTFLISPEAGFITGQLLVVDGGYSLCQ